MPTKWFISVLSWLAMTLSGNAEETVLFCTEQHLVGLQYEAEEWGPIYGNQDHGRRYAIRFNSDKSQMSGIHGGNTLYQCRNYFPNKAPDVITCINPLVATMVFNYSTESKRFLFSLVGPRGWLGVETEREDEEPFVDHLIMGTCQEF